MKQKAWDDETTKKTTSQASAPTVVRKNKYNDAVKSGKPLENVKSPGEVTSPFDTTVQRQQIKSVVENPVVNRVIKNVGFLGTELIGELAQAPEKISSGAGKLIANTARGIESGMSAPVTDMRSKLNPEPISGKQDTFDNKLVDAMSKIMGNEPQPSVQPVTQPTTSSLHQDVVNNLMSMSDSAVKQVTPWEDPWNKAVVDSGVISTAGGVLGAGVENMFGLATKPLAMAGNAIQQYGETNFGASLSPVERFIDSAVVSAGTNYARKLITGQLAAGDTGVFETLNDIAMFLPAFTEGYQDAINRGMSESQAVMNGVLRGGIETGTEKLSDPWKYVSSSGLPFDQALKKWIANRKNLTPVWKYIMTQVIGVLSEAGEEVAAAGLNAVADRAMYGEQIDPSKVGQDMLTSAGASVISSVILAVLGGDMTSEGFRKYSNELAAMYAQMSDQEKYEAADLARKTMQKQIGKDTATVYDLVQRADGVTEDILAGTEDTWKERWIANYENGAMPLAFVKTEDGEDYPIYEYFGTKTADQTRAIDNLNRLGIEAYIADGMPDGMNALTTDDGVVIISADCENPVQRAAIHEAIHAMKNDGTWMEFYKYVLPELQNQSDYQEIRKQILYDYSSYYAGIQTPASLRGKSENTIRNYVVKRAENLYNRDQDFRDLIDEELVARYAEDHLFNRSNQADTEKAMRALFNRTGTGAQRLWQRIKDVAADLNDRIAHDITDEERNLLKAEKLFAKVVNEENQKEEQLSSGLRYSIKSIGIDLEGGTNSQMIQDMIKAGLFGTVNPSDEASYDAAKAQAEIFITNVNNLVDLLHDRGLDLFEEGGKEDRAFFPYKLNQDDLYKISLDYSTLCKKRIITQAIIEKLNVERKRALDAQTQFAITQLLRKYQAQESKLQVACALCYVEAARLKTPDVTNRFMDDPAEYMRRYFLDKPGDGKDILNQKQQEYKEAIGVDPKASKEALGQQASEKFTIGEYNDIMRRIGAPEVEGNSDSMVSAKAATDSYYQNTLNLKRSLGDALTDEQKAAIELAQNLDPKYYLTAQGRTDLKLGKINGQDVPLGRLVYDALITAERSAAHSKALETGVPYYWGDADNVVIGGKRYDLDKLIKEMNKQNGLRTQSWSDFQLEHLLDEITSTAELATKNAKMHAYTKVPEYVLVNGKTGKMINNSLIPEGSRGLDAYGNLIFSATEGMPIEQSNWLRKVFPDTDGSICIGINDDQIRALMRDSRIDYIIPYHTSSLNYHLREIARINHWDDYTGTQNEKSLPGSKGKKSDIKFSDWFTDDIKNQKKSGLEIMMDAQDKYLRVCAERGFIPKFPQFLIDNGDGTYSIDPENQNYWKLLIDRKMINQETGNIIEQKAVRPDYNWDDFYVDGKRVPGLYSLVREAEDPRTSELVENASGIILKAMNEGLIDKIEENGPGIDEEIERFMQENPFATLGDTYDNDSSWSGDPYEGEEEPSSPRARYSLSPREWDRQYFDALNRGDEEEAKRLRLEHAAERGYTDRVYHGTQNFGFTEPEVNAYSDDAMTFFATPSEDMAFSYSGQEGTRPLNELTPEEIREERAYRRRRAEKQANDFARFFTAVSGVDGFLDVQTVKDFCENTIANNNPIRSQQIIATQARRWALDAINQRDPEYTNKYGDKLEPAFVNFTADLAREYSRINRPIAEGAGNYDLLVNPEGLLNLDAKGQRWSGVGFQNDDAVPEDLRDGYWSTRELAQYANDNGYKGYKLDNVEDYGPYGYLLDADELEPDTVYALLHPESQAKSTDAITYDNEGNIIPLSLRDDPQKPDFRFSARRRTPEEWDSLYNEALANNDKEELQRLRDAHAKENGIDPSKPWYHGTGEYFDTFNRGEEGIHLGDNEQARQVARERFKTRSEQTRYKWDDIREDLEELADTNIDLLYNVASELDSINFDYLENPVDYIFDTDMIYDEDVPIENVIDAIREYGDEIAERVSEEGQPEDMAVRIPTYDREVGEHVMKLYPSSIKPFRINGDLGQWTPDNIADVLLSRGEGAETYQPYGKAPIDISGSKISLDPDEIRTLTDISNGRYSTENAWDELDSILLANGYNGIQYKNEYEGDRKSPSRLYMDAADVKLSDAVTYDDNGNVIPLSQRDDPLNPKMKYSLGRRYNNWEDVPAQEGNWGYHAGNLGKAESRGSQGYYRGTGHFGTGTYFVGNPSELRYGYGDRPVESVDFSQYNLFTPRNSNEADLLHEFLKMVDGRIYGGRAYTDEEISNYQDRAYEAIDSDDPYLMADLIQEGREMMGGYFQHVLDMVNRWNGTNFSDEERWNPDTDEIIPPVTMDDLLLYGPDVLSALSDSLYEWGTNSNRSWFDNRNITNRANRMIEPVADMLGVSPSMVKTLAERIDTADYGEDMSRTDDSLATRFMKALGYEGVDTRHIPDFDNTRYGSVIYDLKGDDLARKQANGARFSLAPQGVPDQANPTPQRNNPQDLGAMRFLGKQSRERMAADPLTYESITPESFPVPDRIQDYLDLIEDDVDRQYSFDTVEEDETDTDGDLYRSIQGNKSGALQGFATPTQMFNTMMGKDGEQREFFRDRYEKPMYVAKQGYNANREERWTALEKMIEETGIKANTLESAAVQWYGEKAKPNEQGETVPYSLDDLKKEFPEKWKDIVKMEKFMRDMYDEYVGRINEVLEQVYPNLEGKAQAQLEAWRNRRRAYQDEISLSRTPNGSRNPAAVEYLEGEIAKLDAKIAKLEAALKSGEYFRNKRLNPRKDYFHHFQELETKGIGGLKNILQATTLIDPELVGKTEFTKPKSRWMSWLQRRGQGAYTADAVLGLGKYIDSAEYAIAFDPLIAQYRDEISNMVKATRQTKNANQLIQYLSAYTNQLAGKTPSLDRTVLDLLGEGNRGQLFTVLAAINNRAKSNAVVGNVRSAVSQVFNIPNAMSIIKSNSAWTKAVSDYLSTRSANRDLIESSPFLQERYFAHNVDDLKARNTTWEKIAGKAGEITNKMMEIGDKEATELIWYAAYNEAIEKGVSDPVYYADDLTRQSVAGRGVGEVPYNMKSKVASFFMPFQVETNNAWQNLKGMIREKDAKGIFRLMMASWLMNSLVRPLFGDGVVPDVLDPLIEGLKKLFDKDREETVGETLLNTGKRMAGEAVSYIPGTGLWLPAIMSSDSAEALFGDSDPTRYGTGTVGLSTITETMADAVNGDGFDLMTPLLQMGLPYGGRQASRLYNTLQDLNVIPSNGIMNTPFGGEKNPAAGDYSKSGALKYRLPDGINSLGDAGIIAQALAFGPNSTAAAQEYFDSGYKPALTAERVEKYKENKDVVDIDNYIQYLKEANADGKNGISQAEAYDWLSSNTDLSDEERSALWDMTNSNWTTPYDKYNKVEVDERLTDADADGNGKITQEEAYNWLSKQNLSEAEKEKIWNSNGWKKSYKDYDKSAKKQKEKETVEAKAPMSKEDFTAKADTNSNGRVTQAEAYAYLSNSNLSKAQIDALWALGGWKTTYDVYESYHSK